MFAKVENGVTKLAKLFAGKTGKTQIWPEISHFLEQDRLLFGRVDIGVTEFPTTKTAEKEERIFGGLRFLFKSGRAHPVFNGEFPFFWPQKNYLFWRGV